MTGPAQLDDVNEIRRLVGGAFALRASALQNEIDEKAARIDRRRFVYFVDPNTVIWYCRPHEHQNLSGFDPPRTVDAAEPAPDFPIAFATLDYIFGRTLPGAEQSPLYISHAHAEEFFSSDRLQLKRRTKRVEGGEALLVSAVKALREHEDVPDNIDDLFAAVQRSLGHPILSATFAAQRYEEMADRKLVRRAHYEYLRPPNGPSWESLASRRALGKSMWASRLVTHRQHAEQSVNLDRDAETLAELEVLNELSLVYEQGRSFVLVTVDRAIHLAMAEWVEEAGPTGDRTPFSRHPRQYMPLLNLNSAASIRLDTEFFQRVKRAATDLAEAADVVVVKPPIGPQAHVFTHERADDLRGQSWQQLARQAGRLRDEWQRAMQTATALIIKSLDKTTLRPLDRVISLLNEQLNDEAVAAVLVQVIEQQSERIVRSNRAFAISGRLLALTMGMHAHAAPRLPSLLRAPEVREVDVFMHRHGADPNDLFENFLSEVLKGPTDQRAGIIDEFEQLLILLSDVEAYSFSAYVAFRMRDWRSVRYFARSFETAARELPPDAPQRRFAQGYLAEARYARHVADRFLLDTADEIRRLRVTLVRDCTRTDNDLFERARSASELAALTLVMIVRARDGQFTVLESNLREMLSDAARWIHHGLRWNHAQPGGLSERRRLLDVQMRTNLAAVHLFRAAMFDERAGVQGDPAANQALSSLQQLNGGHAAHGMARLYEHGLALILAGDDKRRQASLALLRQALREMSQSGTFSDPLDQKVRAWFANFASRESGLAVS